MSTFGIAFLRKEGGSFHPDDPMSWQDSELSDEEYLELLRNYMKDNGLTKSEVQCSRKHLLEN